MFEYAVILLLMISVIYLLKARYDDEIKSVEEIERLSAINDNLRHYIRDLERDLDAVCLENERLKSKP